MNDAQTMVSVIRDTGVLGAICLGAFIAWKVFETIAVGRRVKANGHGDKCELSSSTGPFKQLIEIGASTTRSQENFTHVMERMAERSAFEHKAIREHLDRIERGLDKE